MALAATGVASGRPLPSACRVESVVCSILGDRTRHAARGFLGGGPGAVGEVLVDGVSPSNPKAEQLVPPGALVEVRLPGGGGYGSAEQRDGDLVAADRREGYITS